MGKWLADTWRNINGDKIKSSNGWNSDGALFLYKTTVQQEFIYIRLENGHAIASWYCVPQKDSSRKEILLME